jgi:putative FmdB family regulatory protein
MPVYEYECKACGRDFEYQQRMTEPEKTTCEACGGALERLISRTAFALKGAGWYKDLYSKADGSFDARKGKDYDPKEAKDKAESAKDKGATDAKSPGSGSEGSGASSGGGSSGASGGGSSGASGGGSSGSSGGGSSGSTAKAS